MILRGAGWGRSKGGVSTSFFLFFLLHIYNLTVRTDPTPLFPALTAWVRPRPRSAAPSSISLFWSFTLLCVLSPALSKDDDVIVLL